MTMGFGMGPGMMGGGWGGYGYGYGLIHMIVPVVIFIGILALVVWLVRSVAGASIHHLSSAQRPGGLDVLEERYARGDINRDDFLQKKRDISG